MNLGTYKNIHTYGAKSKQLISFLSVWYVLHCYSNLLRLVTVPDVLSGRSQPEQNWVSFCLTSMVHSQRPEVLQQQFPVLQLSQVKPETAPSFGIFLAFCWE